MTPAVVLVDLLRAARDAGAPFAVAWPIALVDALAVEPDAAGEWEDALTDTRPAWEAGYALRAAPARERALVLVQADRDTPIRSACALCGDDLPAASQAGRPRRYYTAADVVSTSSPQRCSPSGRGLVFGLVIPEEWTMAFVERGSGAPVSLVISGFYAETEAAARAEGWRRIADEPRDDDGCALPDSCSWAIEDLTANYGPTSNGDGVGEDEPRAEWEIALDDEPDEETATPAIDSERAEDCPEVEQAARNTLVPRVIRLHREGHTQRQISAILHVSQPTICRILKAAA